MLLTSDELGRLPLSVASLLSLFIVQCTHHLYAPSPLRLGGMLRPLVSDCAAIEDRKTDRQVGVRVSVRVRL